MIFPRMIACEAVVGAVYTGPAALVVVTSSSLTDDEYAVHSVTLRHRASDGVVWSANRPAVGLDWSTAVAELARRAEQARP